MRCCRSVVLALALAVCPTTLGAQVTLAVSGFGGAYLPAADLLFGVFQFNLEPQGLRDVAATFSQNVGFLGGGRVTIWPTERFGIEVEGIYTVSKLNLAILVPFQSDPGPPPVLGLTPAEQDFNAHILMGSVNAVLALIRPPLEPLVVYVSGGIGGISRGGDGFEAFDATLDVAGVWGFGIKYGIAPGFWIRGDVKDYISSFKEEDFDAEIQNDILVTAGIEFSFGG